MKVRIELPGEANAWLSVDGEPSTHLRVGESRTLDCKEFTISGNPLDTWRIVVWVKDVWKLEDLSDDELEGLFDRMSKECSRRGEIKA